MLRLFSKKPDHPLANDADVGPLLEALAKQKPETAIDEGTGWLESLAGLDDFPAALRYRRTVELDKTLIAQARRLAREYYTSARSTRFEEQQRWQRNQGYWTQLSAAYTRCLADCDAGLKGSNAIKAEIGLLEARLLHALAGRLRWTRLRYGKVDAAQWQELGAIYRRAVDAGLAERVVTLYDGPDSASSPAIEYLKVLLFHASSIDNLTLLEVGIAERLLAHFRPHFVFGDKPTPETTYWIDAAQDQPPARLVLEKPPALTPTLRLFGAGQVLERITALSARIRANQMVPPELNLGGQYAPDAVLPVLDHLAQCWSPKPPQRKHARHAVQGRASVVAGLQTVYWYVSGGGSVLDTPEEWQVDDISQGGVSATLPLLRNNWARVGALVGLRPDGNTNWLIGAIRRFVRETESQGSAGIETLSKTPHALTASAGSLETEIIVLDPLRHDSSARILVAPCQWEVGVALRATADGQSWRLHPDERIEVGEDWLLGRCVVERLGT